MNTLKIAFRYFINIQNEYKGCGMMLALYFASLFFIAFYKGHKREKSIVLPSAVLLFFPYVLLPIYSALKAPIDEAYQGRIFWVFITPVITAIGVTIFVTNIEEKKIRIFAILMIIPICILCGDFKISRAMYKKAENLYRLPQSCVDITNHITQNGNEPMIIVPYTIAHPFRQISTKVRLLYGEDASYGRIGTPISYYCYVMCDEMERTTPDLPFIVQQMEDFNVDYIVFDTVYTEFCENGNINIYGYSEDENYVGDRTSTVTYDDIGNISVIDDENGIYWDLSSYGLSYDGTYGQYILYKRD